MSVFLLSRRVLAPRWSSHRWFTTPPGLGGDAPTSAPTQSAPAPSGPSAPAAPSAPSQPPTLPAYEASFYPLLNELGAKGLGRFADALYHGGVRTAAEVQRKGHTAIAETVGAKGEDRTRLYEALDGFVLRETLGVNSEAVVQCGVTSVKALRDPLVLKKLRKEIPPEALRSILLVLEWYPMVRVHPQDRGAKTATAMTFPKDAMPLLILWMRTQGRVERSLDEMVRRAFARLRPKDDFDEWFLPFNPAARLNHPHLPLQQAAVELILQIQPTLKTGLSHWLGQSPRPPPADLAALLAGLLQTAPKPLSQTLAFLQPRKAGKRALKPRRWRRLPKDLIAALEILYNPPLSHVVAQEKEAWERPRVTRRMAAYAAHLQTLTKDHPKTKKGELSPEVREAMVAWEAEYDALREDRKRLRRRLKVRDAHWARLLAALPDETTYACSEVTQVADFWDQEFFARMMVWWKLNRWYDLDFPDLHRTVGQGRPMLPDYKKGLVPDGLNRSL